MKKAIIVAFISAFLVTGCTIGFMGGHRGESMLVVPALPVTVELDADQNYYQNGYYYRYQGNVWLYSSSRQGVWSRLPRSHYPRDVRYWGQIDRDQGDRGHDRHDQDNRDHDYGQRN
jgi:hypothetical protein